MKRAALEVPSIFQDFRRGITGQRLWRCNGCASLEPWSANHTWYGSWKDLDESGKVVIACSDQCRTELIGIGLIPKDAPQLDDDDKSPVRH